MKNVKLLCLSSALIVGGNAVAQTVPQHDHYVQQDDKNTPFYSAYTNWTPGQPLYSGDAANDDEFFISRVKPKSRFTNANTQVDPNLNSNRKLLWWCPIGTTDGDNWNAIPSYFFDSEVFSMWSYVDIYGNWTAPFIRMAGAFTDICHKNGVATSVVAAVPYGASISENDGGHGQNIKALYSGGTDKFLKFLRYYGIDGIGFNSEFYSGALTTPLKEMLSGAFEKKDEANWPTFHNVWYSFMTNEGSIGDYSVLNSRCKEWFNWNGKTTSNAYFLNYNWHNSQLNTSQETARAEGRSSFDVYAGMDFQGRSVAEWRALKNYDISVGIWGAHNMNMIFEGRGELGSSPEQRQKTYQLISENTFTGSSYNPVNTPEISDILRHTTTATNFHGFSSFITARSAMATDNLAEEPMYTYFNLGNGKFFNVEGKTTFNNEWYNIGIQDYLPTWRWWWTSNFMGRQVTDVPSNGMKAEFTYEDAWFGGSCLQISGQTEQEYLHLFKTQYPVKAGDKLTIRYKVVSGTGTVAWACSVNDAESTEVNGAISALTPDDETWVEKTILIGTGRTHLKIADKTMAMLALKFTDTSSDFKINIGEISLTSHSASPTPAAPVLRMSNIMKRNYQGVDMKIVYKMISNVPTTDGDPIYNADVATSYFKIYTQQEGAEPTMCTATTSWAAYVVSAPYDETLGGKVRIGVSAVSLDGKSESAITWGEYQEVPIPTVKAGIRIDKPVIKANEEFTVSYIDPNYPAAKKWIIEKAQSEEVVGTVLDANKVTTSLSEEGIYNLILTDFENNIEKFYGIIQISSSKVGALPRIESIKANDSEEAISVEKDATVTYSYVGRAADGQVSRGLNLSEKAFGIDAQQLDFSTRHDFSICFWFKANSFNHGPDGTQLLNIRTTKDRWPASDWGFIWSTIQPDNTFAFNFRDTGNSGSNFKLTNFKFAPNQWYHVAYVIDHQKGSVCTIYINGKKVGASDPTNSLYAWNNTNYIMIGGNAFNRAGLDGCLDEFQLYDRKITDEEVVASMSHLTTIPSGLIGYWDFESEVDGEHKMSSIGTRKDLKASLVKIETISEGKNEFNPQEVAFTTGAPFIPGDLYKVETKPSWNISKATVVNSATGNDTEGSVQVQYKNDGQYSATLTLSNGWGSDIKTFNFVTVEDPNKIDNTELVSDYTTYPNPFVNTVMVRFAKDGSYQILVTNANGQLVNRENVNVTTGEFVKMQVNGNPGVYFFTIQTEGKTLKVIKVIKE